MKTDSADLVSRALRDPDALARWPLARWDELVRQARRANLLARIAAELERRNLLGEVPPAPRAHLRAACVMAQAQREGVHREVAYIRKALSQLEIDIVFLKGAAYVLAELPAADGRLFSDVDILVPQHALGDVEARLREHGWHHAHEDDDYYQRYYREWGHELPPMQHAERRSVIDVHHAILPRTARFKPDSGKLLSAARPVFGEARVRVLAPIDMVLHSAAHLFQNEELTNGLRDLSDLDSLLRHFGRSAEFWAELPRRAAELDLATPLYYGLRYTTRILGTPVPEDVLTACAERRRATGLRLMDALWLRALRPDHPSVSDWLSGAARSLLYARAHWMRMPPRLLLYHFAAKSLREARKKAKGAEVRTAGPL